MPDDTTEARVIALLVLHKHRRDRDGLTFNCAADAMLAYAATVRRETREECARVADREEQVASTQMNAGAVGAGVAASRIAAAIRRLGSDG